MATRTSKTTRALTLLATLAAIQAAAVLIYLAARPQEPLSVERPDGAHVRLPQDRPLLLHFWATWCPPCRDELPDLLALGRRLAAEGGPELWAVTTDREWPVVRDYFDGEVPAAVFRAPGGALTRRFAIETLPVTLLLGRDGAVLLRYDGARRWGDPDRAAEIRRAAER